MKKILSGFILFIILFSAVKSEISESRQQYSLRLGIGHIFDVYPDPRFLISADYFSSVTSLVQLSAEFDKYFNEDLQFYLAGLNVSGAEKQVLRQTFNIQPRAELYFHFALIHDAGFMKFMYGSTALIVFKDQNRQSMDSTGVMTNQSNSNVIDTENSYPFPSLGFYLFPKQDLGMEVGFLDENSNFQYGWLGILFRYSLNENHTFLIGGEMFNRNNFGARQRKFCATAFCNVGNLSTDLSAISVSD